MNTTSTKPRKKHLTPQQRAEIRALTGTVADIEIAARYGISRERVRQYRKMDGKPRAPGKARRAVLADPELHTLTVMAMAAKHDVSGTTVCACRKIAGVQPPKTNAQRCAEIMAHGQPMRLSAIHRQVGIPSIQNTYQVMVGRPDLFVSVGYGWWQLRKEAIPT